jgi:hypothetical protein
LASVTGLPVGVDSFTRPCGHNMPNVVSLPITAMSTGAPPARIATSVSCVCVSTAFASRARSYPAQAAGTA